MKNGEYKCPLSELTEDVVNNALEKIEETHTMLSQLLEHTEHLKELHVIALSISDIKSGLLASATSKDQNPTKLTMQIIKIMGFVILGLTVILVAVLTGIHLGWINAVK